jgi:hypothetical protein
MQASIRRKKATSGGGSGCDGDVVEVNYEAINLKPVRVGDLQVFWLASLPLWQPTESPK